MTSAPEVKQKQALSLWIVPCGNGKVRRLRLSFLSLFIITILLGATVISMAWLVGDYARVNWHRLRSYVLMRQVEAERDLLLKREGELNAQIKSLSELRSESLAYEQDIRQKLSELSNVLERSTSLEVIEEDENMDSAAPLEDGPAVEGMGGAEVDCFTGGGRAIHCGTRSTLNQQISLLNFGLRDWYGSTAERGLAATPSDNAAKLNNAWSTGTAGGEGLISLIDRYIKFVETLPLDKPAKGGKLSSGFGFRLSPFTRHLSLHEGIDLSLSYGTNIFATAIGKVVRIEKNSTYGLMIDVEHSDKVITRYAHLSRTLVSEGELVKAGQLIGLAGSSGRSTGPHLHYEVRVEGRAKNPRNFLSLGDQLKELL